MNETTVRTLRAAAELLSAPERWTQGALSVDANGYSIVEYHDREAYEPVAWCALGAISYSANGIQENCDAQKALERALERLGFGVGIEQWNDDDTRSHSDVTLAFKHAIELAETE